MNRILVRKLGRDLRHRWAQAAAVATSVALGVAIFVITSGLAGDLRDSYRQTYERTRFADVWASGDPAALEAALAGMTGLDRVEVRTSTDVGARFADRSITTRITGYRPGTELNQLVVTAGRADAGGGVVLERHTAEHFGLGPGDSIEIAGHGSVPVTGVATSPEWLWVAPSQQELVVDPDEFAVIFAPEELAAAVAPDRSEQVVVEVAGHDPAIADAAASRLLEAGAVEVFTRRDHPSDSALQADIEGFEQVAAIMPILFLGAAALSAAVLLGRLIVQQRPEIGMMRANGFSAATLLRHYSGYGVAITTTGALVGIPLGILGSGAASDAYTGFLGLPFAAHSLRPGAWVVGLVAAVVVGSAAGAVPARAAAAVDPAVAMRPGGAEVAGSRSVVERVLPAGAPSWLVIAARNLNRQPRRAATTGLGIVLALVLCVIGLVLNDTITTVFDHQFGSIDRRELVVWFDRAVDAQRLEEVAAVGGVAAAEPHLELDAALVAGDGIAATRLQVFQPATGLHGFDEPLPDAGILLSATTADRLGVGSGDQVELRAGADAGGLRISIPVAGLVDEPLGGTSYLSTTAWEALSGPAPTAVAIELDDRSTHRATAGELDRLDGVVRVGDVVATGERARELLAAATFFAAVILALAVAMAAALIFNAVTVTLGERETEVATLQANGVGRRWIRRAITSENLMAALAATIPGLVVGRILAGWFVGQFSSEQITLDPVLRPWSLVVAVGLILATALAAQLPGLRRLDRLDLAVKVRERSL
jgi:putative ABC transport system permease protein